MIELFNYFNTFERSSKLRPGFRTQTGDLFVLSHKKPKGEPYIEVLPTQISSQHFRPRGVNFLTRCVNPLARRYNNCPGGTITIKMLKVKLNAKASAQELNVHPDADMQAITDALNRQALGETPTQEDLIYQATPVWPKVVENFVNLQLSQELKGAYPIEQIAEQSATLMEAHQAGPEEFNTAVELIWPAEQAVDPALAAEALKEAIEGETIEESTTEEELATETTEEDTAETTPSPTPETAVAVVGKKEMGVQTAQAATIAKLEEAGKQIDELADMSLALTQKVMASQKTVREAAISLAKEVAALPANVVTTETEEVPAQSLAI